MTIKKVSGRRVKTVFKYRISNKTSLDLPVGSKFLFFGSQQDGYYTWFEVCPTAEKKVREFEIFGTGQDIESDLKHLGSIQDQGYVWHLYERLQS